MNYKSLIIITSIFLIQFSAFAGYIESEKYGFSFFLKETYKKQKIKTPYGFFVQLEHPESLLFIHFWARKRVRGIDKKYLKKAYESDFMKSFIQKTISENKIILSNNKILIIERRVQLLEQEYLMRQFYFSNRKKIYTLVFYYIPRLKKELKNEIKKDMDLIMESLLY